MSVSTSSTFTNHKRPIIVIPQTKLERKKSKMPQTSLLSLSKYEDKRARQERARILAYAVSNSHKCTNFLNLNLHGPAVSICVENY